MQSVVTRETGYARNASESAYPNLWRGLAGWWCPSINPRGGNRLFDLLPYQNHGTLTGMANDDWVVSGGQGALDFDGINDNVRNDSWSVQQQGRSQISVSLWARFAGAASRIEVCSFFGLDGTHTAYFVYRNSAGRATAEFGSGAGAATGTTVINSQIWVHLCGTYDTTTNRIYRSGNLESSTTYTLANLSGSRFVFGAYHQNAGAPNQLPLFGQLDDVRIYNRVLTPSEIRLLASKRGIGLEPRQKHYTYTQQPSGARRRRLLTGMV